MRCRSVLITMTLLVVACSTNPSGRPGSSTTSTQQKSTITTAIQRTIKAELTAPIWVPTSVAGFSGPLQGTIDNPVDYPFLTFKLDGTWTGSDGCNGLSGTYTLDEIGSFTGSPGAQTKIGCANVENSNVVREATSITITSETLTFHDASKAVLGKYRPLTPTSPGTNSGPQLPPAVLTWLRTYASHAALGKATSADWVLRTRDNASILVSGALPSNTDPVYLFDVHGTFVWDHSCPPGASPAAYQSIGNDEVFTVDPKRLEVLDFGVHNKTPNLAAFGTVGHVSL